MSLFSSLTFSEPWILAGLIVLPAIWFLLRVTPPLPRRVVFPPLRLLLGLNAAEETPARTPWWLLLLRLIAAALIILALAAPMIGTPPKPLSNGPLVLFVDNGWTAAHAWKERETAIEDALTGAARAGRAVAIVPTANPPSPVNLLDSGSAQRTAEQLAPVSWLPDRKNARAALARMHFSSAPEILWLSDGLDYSNDTAPTLTALQKIGTVRVVADPPSLLPLALKPETSRSDGFVVTVIRAAVTGTRTGRVSALGSRGENLASAEFAFRNGSREASAKIVLPLEVRNETQRIVIDNENSAGATRLLDSNAKRRAVGLISASNTESDQPLLSDIFYLERALSPYADLSKGTVSDALQRNVGIMVLADIGRIAGADYDRVEKFVSGGGVLVRFAGARMTQNVDDLIPVKLRSGGRYLGGALDWAKPQQLAPFPEVSPFRGLAIPKEVTVSRQVLAEPSVDLDSHVWARLADGTPLVTAAQHGRGWIVLFHVTAGPAWSTLPLSGLYVDMLRRLLALASGARPSELAVAHAVYPPYAILDGFGEIHKPTADVLPLRGNQIESIRPSRLYPAGLYGSEDARVALNAVDANTELTPFGDIGTSVLPYTGTSATPLQAPLLLTAFLLLLADVCLSLYLRGYVANTRRLFARFAVFALAAMLIHPGAARADDAFDMKAALDTHLAYVITGIPDVDAMSKQGLYGLGRYLQARTSYDPKDPMGVDPAKDNLAFFPLLYWPMDPREPNLSPQAQAKIEDYMRNGGTILIDTRDLTLGATRGADSPGQQTLKRLFGKMDLPPLEPVPPDHVLRKAFYLLSDFPGRWDGGKVWVQALPPPDPDAGPEPARGGDSVSPVIIGGNDWAAAWAIDDKGRGLVAVSPGGDQQREMALRFGINVVMYALTGNYKTDQVHVPALLERGGK